MAPNEQLAADEFVQRFHAELIPFSAKLHWFSVVAMSPEDFHVNVEEPLTSLPPRLVEALPRLNLYLVPYLKMRGSKTDLITFEVPEPADRSDCFHILGPEEASLLIASQDLHGNELHYNLFSAIAAIAWEVSTAEIRDTWSRSLKDELKREVHGEIDEMSWQKKNALLAKQAAPLRESKMFREYARASYIDTMTLFLHGICCDIDVEPSPRQIPGNEIRRRLELLRGLYPLGEGFALFPEELRKDRPRRNSRRRGSSSDENGGKKAAAAPVKPPAGSDTTGSPGTEDGE